MPFALVMFYSAVKVAVSLFNFWCLILHFAPTAVVFIAGVFDSFVVTCSEAVMSCIGLFRIDNIGNVVGLDIWLSGVMLFHQRCWIDI